VGYKRAENTSDVATDEGDLAQSQYRSCWKEGEAYLGLDEFSVFALWFGESRVDVFYDTFERSEFHHGIRDLSSPKRL